MYLNDLLKILTKEDYNLGASLITTSLKFCRIYVSNCRSRKGSRILGIIKTKS
jgi:hypothetical protein